MLVKKEVNCCKCVREMNQDNLLSYTTCKIDRIREYFVEKYLLSL